MTHGLFRIKYFGLNIFYSDRGTPYYGTLKSFYENAEEEEKENIPPKK